MRYADAMQYMHIVHKHSPFMIRMQYAAYLISCNQLTRAEKRDSSR